MRFTLRTLLLLILISTLVLPGVMLTRSAVKASRQAAGPTLLKRTVGITLKKYLRYWKNPQAAEPQYDTWSWVPRIDFEMIGPIPEGSQVLVDFSFPDGKPWMQYPLRTEELPEDGWGKFSSYDLPISDSDLEKKATIQTGAFPFKIILKNSLLGSNDVLFAGKFKVATFTPDQKIPEFKNKQEFYIQEDWRLPFGYIWLDPSSDENVPTFKTQFWIRNADNYAKMEAFLYYKGKQVAETQSRDVEQELTTAVDDKAYKWTLRSFGFATVRGFNKDTSSANDYSSLFFLDKNLGEYELKILRDSKLDRIAKFTVGADGKIVDNGIAKANKLGGVRMVLPVAIVSEADGKWDRAAWKTDAMYGNPLSGFTAIEGGSTPEPGSGTATTPATTSTSTATTAAPATGGPTLLKYSLHVRARRMVRYWKFPDQDNYWSWIPEVEFQVLGPVAGGSQFQVDFTLPDGKPWTTLNCNTDAVAAGQVWKFNTEWERGHDDKRAIIDAGTFGFKIRLKNELSNLNYEVFSGKFNVNKFHVGNELPQFKNQFEYYVDQDWNLPIGYLWLNVFTSQDAPPLVATMWFRGENDDTKLAGYVLYNGKIIASTKDSTSGVASYDKAILTSGNDADPRWERWNFIWNKVRGWKLEGPTEYPGAHFLSVNPGEYEIKVLNQGELVRQAKFTVGADGRIVDNGIATQNKLGGISMVLPVKVLGPPTIKMDLNAWKTDAFYKNPLTGFTAPQ